MQTGVNKANQKYYFLSDCFQRWKKNAAKMFTSCLIIGNHCYHSHYKWKDSLKTQAVLIEISILKFPSDPKHQGSLLKKHGFL